MKQRMIIPGGSGFLGQLLAEYFSNKGWEVVILTRKPGRGTGKIRELAWDGRAVGMWARELEGAQCVVNLAGRSVNCRYTAGNRREILESRVLSTAAVGAAIQHCAKPPELWLNCSTATIYKHTYGEAWTEGGVIEGTAEAKDAFSVEVARQWEAELAKCQTPGTRKVALRLAMVLGQGRNSVYPVLRRLTRFGLGGKMGTGKQYVSWIHQQDFCRAVEWIIHTREIEGVINLAAPSPLTNQEMVQILREVTGVRFGLPAPRFLLELGAVFLGTETELIIKSRRVVPGRLLGTGFQFEYPGFKAAVKNLEEERKTRAGAQSF